MSPRIAIDRGAVNAFCERHYVARLALFGSVLRDDFDADSDVDVLVEFRPGHVPGLNFSAWSANCPDCCRAGGWTWSLLSS